jgi:hypothetical protein
LYLTSGGRCRQLLNEDVGIGLQRPIAARAKVLDRQVSSQAQRMV